jgi:hypothetical protein
MVIMRVDKNFEASLSDEFQAKAQSIYCLQAAISDVASLPRCDILSS